MTIAEFTIDGMSAWINDISQKYLASVRIIDCIPWGAVGGQAIFEIEGSKGRAAYIIKDIKDHRDITSIDMNPPEGGRLKGVVGMNNCAFIRLLMASGCFLESAVAEGDGKVRFRVVVGAEGSLPDLFRKLEEKGIKPELMSLSPTDDRDQLTVKQEEVIRLALEKGYFDTPRRISAKELAQLCGVSPASFGDVLKRAERNLLRSYFKDKR
ncbi:MAG: helix-turn-helix domain-containing protein [Candidatus Saccharibacteria bacterium]